MRYLIPALIVGLFATIFPANAVAEATPRSQSIPRGQTVADQPPRVMNPAPPGSRVIRTTGSIHRTGDENAPRFDLNFPGGTSEELIEAISRASGKPVNAIIPDNGRSMQIPAFKVHGVTEFELLTSLHERNVIWVWNGSNYDGRNLGYSWEPVSSSQKENLIWRMRIEYLPEIPPIINVIPVNISEYLSHYSIEDISTAISLVWNTAEDIQAKPDIKFHPETQLLIIRGTDSQLQRAREVLKLLKEEMNKQRIRVYVGGTVRYVGNHSFEKPPTLTEVYYKAGGSPNASAPAEYQVFDIIDIGSRAFVSEGSLIDILNGTTPDITIYDNQEVNFGEPFRRKTIRRDPPPEASENNPTSESSK